MPPQVARQHAIVDGGGGSNTTGLVGQQPGGGSTTCLAQYLAALLDPRYRRQSQHVTREQRKLAEQLLLLRRQRGLSAVYFAPQLTTDPVRWWRLHGDFAPELQTVAQRVLCIPATAAANERVFSAFRHVWSDKRASLILGRMWIMAYIYFNKRVLERKPETLSDADWEEYERCWKASGASLTSEMGRSIRAPLGAVWQPGMGHCIPWARYAALQPSAVLSFLRFAAR
ncbi:dimer_Tnp_hAT domain-containing protein, partial [Haematococcus lacustris]